MGGLIVTVKEARELGLLRYFTGKPCKHGHIAERLTSNKTCMACACRIQSGVYSRHGDKVRKRVSEYRYANKEEIARRDAAYQRANRDRLRRYYSERYQRKREEIAAKVKAYQDARPGFSNEIKKAYVLRKQRAMPSWVNRSELRKIYAEAAALTQRTGVVHSVDHIHPLKGRNSCGLHVPWNLQIITKVENCRKSNKTPEEWRADLMYRAA